ncbi:MAG: hypothetical protein ABII00_01060 [Elusimicrobiota bacterium]
MAAGAAAAAIGAMLAGKYGQMTQGIPYILGGGVIGVQAAMVLMKADQAGKDAEEGIENAGQTALDDTAANLETDGVGDNIAKPSTDGGGFEPKPPTNFGKGSPNPADRTGKRKFSPRK